MRRLARRAAALGVCLALAGACQSPAPPNVIVILVDTLRADRLGAYGSQRKLTPFLDELAARGTVFRRTTSASSWTNPSVASLFTSRFLAQHQVTTFRSAIADGSRTLAEVLKERGYRTGGFVANGLLLTTLGFSRGFDQFKLFWNLGEQRKFRAAEVNADALQWLDGLRSEPPAPTFLYLHYVEPHIPYTAPEGVLHELYGETIPDVAAVTAIVTYLGRGSPAPYWEDIRRVYDAEVVALDRDLRTLFAELDRRGFLRNALIVVTSDHGEELGDHGGIGHGHSLHSELTDIPLLVIWDGHVPADIVRGRAALIDVAPTILGLLGAPKPLAFEGRALLGPTAERLGGPVFSELLQEPSAKDSNPAHDRLAIVEEDRKYVLRQDGTEAFYDLAADPGEQHPEALDPPAREALRNGLTASVAGQSIARHETPVLPPPDADTVERMRALGYVK